MEETTVRKDLRVTKTTQTRKCRMPPGDDDSPDLGGTGSGTLIPAPGTPGYPGGPRPDLPLDGIELQKPGSGDQIMAPSAEDPGWRLLASNDDDHPPYPVEVHVEPPQPGRHQDAPGANPDQFMQPFRMFQRIVLIPTPKHPQFPIPRVLRPPSPRNVPLTRSTGAHPHNRRP